MDPIPLTDEDDVEEITHILNQEVGVRETFKMAQRNAESRTAELHALGARWWNGFLKRRGLEQNDDTPQFRLQRTAAGIQVLPVTDGKAQMSDDALLQVLEELGRRKEK